MTYLSVREAAKLWGVSERSVRNYCAQGRVPGAFLTGKTWSIPDGAGKPNRANAAPRAATTASLPAEGKPSPLLARLLDEKNAQVRGGIYHKVQVELAYNSNRIEGSRLSLDQTRLIFETATIGCDGEPLSVDDIVETANHFRAFDYILEHVFEPLCEGMVKQLHAILKSSTADARRDWFAVGDYKKLPNEVAGRPTTPPEEVASALRGLLDAYQPSRTHSFDEILRFHVCFERIHPFQDGNGRVGRLVMFKECLSSGLVPFIVADDMKFFYYRGLSEWDGEKGYLTDTCLAAQDRLKAALDYFRIAY